MARKTGSVNHIHQYFRRDDGLWACAGRDEDCSHFMPKNMSPAPAGRKSMCWGGCNRPFQLTPANMMNDKPMCDDCMEGASELDDYLKDKLKPVTGLAAFGAKLPVKSPLQRVKEEEADEIEVIEPDTPDES